MDANNLYGWAIIQKLPIGGFNWFDVSESTPDKIDSFANCDSEGYLLEVDVRSPKELHDSHYDIPFMWAKMVIYIIHIRALNQSLRHGLILEKVHHMVEFNQSVWLKPYIDFNTKFRKQAKNDFGKGFCESMNSVR